MKNVGIKYHQYPQKQRCCFISIQTEDSFLTKNSNTINNPRFPENRPDFQCYINTNLLVKLNKFFSLILESLPGTMKDLLIKSMFVRKIISQFTANYWNRKLSDEDFRATSDETGLIQQINIFMKVPWIHSELFYHMIEQKHWWRNIFLFFLLSFWFFQTEMSFWTCFELWNRNVFLENDMYLTTTISDKNSFGHIFLSRIVDKVIFLAYSMDKQVFCQNNMNRYRTIWRNAP